MKISSLRMGSLLLACSSFFANAQNLDGDRALVDTVPRGFVRSQSNWQSNEKAFYKKLLSQGKFDTLVVPFQVSGWSFDRSTRSLMTATMSLAIAQSGAAKVPDPYLVARALGDGRRQVEQSDVFSLANALGVKRIIWGYAGHDREGTMHINLVSQEKPQKVESLGNWRTPADEKKFEGIRFADETPPIEAYLLQLPQMLKALGLEVKQPLFDSIVSKLDVNELPDSPLGLSGSSDNPARDAYAFLLYGALNPKMVERAKERFSEKAFLAQLRLSPASPEYRALRARTYMALGQRLAAIKVIGAPQNDEEREVLAALNGNFTDLRLITAREKNPVKRLIEKLDENETGVAYGVVGDGDSLASVKALKLPGTVWPFVAARAFTDHDDWTRFDNAQLKMLLDYELPVKGYSLDALAKGSLSVGDPAKLQVLVNLSVFHHGRKFLEQEASRWCCQVAFNRPGAQDYLELLQSFGSDNLIRAIKFQDVIQGQPEAAISIANDIDPIYKGYPYYVITRAYAEHHLAQSKGDVERESLLKSACQSAFNALYWEQSQSLVAEQSRREIELLERNDYGAYGNFYATDIPYRPYYWTWSDGGDLLPNINNKVNALKNATHEFNGVAELLANYRAYFDREPSRADDLLKSIESRFNGFPGKNKLLAKDAAQRGDTKLAERLYRDNLKLYPALWGSYGDLGDLLFRRGEATASAKVYLAYPGFKSGSDEPRLQVVNAAYEIGSQYYWSGHPELAKPLFVIATDQRTGGEGELTSALRLRLMAGDIPGAMGFALKSAQRYQNQNRYQDYLSMLHASGKADEAWAGFETLKDAGQGPKILESALVSHHMHGLSQPEVLAWVRHSGLKNAGAHGNAAASYLLQFVTTDRTPTPEAIEAIQSMDIGRYKSDDFPGQTFPRTPNLQLLPYHHMVKSTLTLFAEGYRGLKTGEFVSAKAAFDEAALYDRVIYEDGNPYFLPYYAMAAAKTNDVKSVEKLLKEVKPADQDFYYHLARAVLESAAGDSDTALQSLNTARYFAPQVGNWPLLRSHTYAEIAEWVAEMTGSAKIKALTIDWARKSQMVQPWHAWSYALEAKLTSNPMDRKRALAMAYYLDPKSERLAGFKQSEIDEAVKAFGKSNPFLKKHSQGSTLGDV